MRKVFAGILCSAMVAVVVPVWAEPAAPVFKSVKPKTVKPPAPGTKRFITIQIDPEEQKRQLAAMAKQPWEPETAPAKDDSATGEAPASTPTPRAPAHYAWYWNKVSPRLGERAGRFDQAISALSQGPKGTRVREPRLNDLAKIARAHGTDILRSTIGTEVSPALVLAMIAVESGGRFDAQSHAGAVGLMQLIPATAERFDVADSKDPAQNIAGGVSYLDWLMKEFDRDPLMVIAAYNAGENAVKKNDGVPPYAETRDYVPKVLAAWNVARGLCATRPQLVSDGCVFQVTQMAKSGP
ncbi:lytic murein transglycosylase [Thioclava sediminum]|uniref:Lytic murein transglycosylase n=1 Tax=Thioclava sediminum TaxID=1915319 RepID=A0ABX3N2Z2_9RHOB|nr:lytic transglycosylase domain-containing protein [Thioclava sediminum]OOY25997.1 lytic murein transglycosylase [Thioclava sediminum]